jgi:adenine-specific DNA-methyltransferase
MKLKHAIIDTMDRDLLKAVCDDLKIDGVDRRSREDMAAAVSRAHRAKPEDLIEYLNEKQVKAVCELVGIEAGGRRGTLIKLLLDGTGAPQILSSPPNGETHNERGRQTSADRVPRNDHEEKVSWMSADEIQARATDATVTPRAETHADRRPTKPQNSYTITRTELVWPGKYDEDDNLVEPPRVALPFQVIEVIEEGRASREALLQGTLPLFGARPRGPETEGWRNKLIWGDNLLVMAALLEKFAGRVDLIYIDPPFDTGADFSYKVLVGADDSPLPGKDRSAVEELAYRDTWGKGADSYLHMMRQRLVLLRELLADTGSIFVHLDVHTGPYVKLLMDEIFGRENFQNEIAWYYYNKMHDSRKRALPKAFDQILYYVKSKQSNYTYHRLEEKRDEPVKQLRRVKVDGRMINARDEDGNIIYQERDTRVVDNVWRIRCLQPANQAEWVHFETQKPVDFIERILSVASNPGDLILDAFVGSGSSLVAAERMGRRWIGCDLGRFAIHMSRKRLLDVRVTDPETGEERGTRPFEVLNLGRYERKYWQGVAFGNEPASDIETAFASYMKFILELHHAQPLPGQYVHGKKGSALVHVGAIDAPVTISQVEYALQEAKARGARELHVLGWEWEMGLHDPLAKMAKAQHGVSLRLLSIPREVMDRRAVDAGDVQFFDLAYLEVEVLPNGKGSQASRRIKIRLKDFVIPNTDLIPEEVRNKVRKWSDYVDYWAVDWDFRDDTFINQWQTYRTRRSRSLALETPEHTYEAAGKYRILVKVVDIFGNDTSQLREWEVK